MYDVTTGARSWQVAAYDDQMWFTADGELYSQYVATEGGVPSDDGIYHRPLDTGIADFKLTQVTGNLEDFFPSAFAGNSDHVVMASDRIVTEWPIDVPALVSAGMQRGGT